MTNQNMNRGWGRVAGFALTLAAVAVAGGANVAHAQDNAAHQQAVPNSEIDHATSQWIGLQRSNVMAAPAQPMLGAEASLAYKRYLESFNSKIPDFYGSAMGQAGSGISQGGALQQN
jgi:Protein of unknown function (DUF3613)